MRHPFGIASHRLLVLLVSWDTMVTYHIVPHRVLWQNYASVSKQELRSFLLARLKIFYEEELDVPLVL